MLKEKSKKPISIIIVIAMVLSFIPTSIFADGVEPQVVQDDNSLGTSYGKEVRPEKDDPAKKDSVIMKKSIVQKGTDEFDITLKVTTTEEITTTFTSPDAAVVIVIDNSGSMDDKVSGTNKSRLTVAKEAANTFVDNFVKDNMGSSRKIAVVQFDSNAKTILGWTEAKESTSNVKAAINSIRKDTNKNNQGTNIEAGLRIANNILGNNSVKDIENLFVVLLTDGVPTCYVEGESTSQSEIKGKIGGGNYATPDDVIDIPTIANSIKAKANNNTKLYTINFGATGNIPTEWNWWGNITKTIGVNTWLSSFATQNVSADNVAELTTAFETISNNIRKQTQAWKITDPMGEFIIFNEEANTRLNVNYDINNPATLTFDRDKKQLTWDLKSEAIRKTTETIGNGENEKTITTYELTYYVKLDISNPDFKENVNYDTNGTTTLTYVFATTANGETTLGDLKTADFNVPRVRGTIPSYPYVIEYYQADKTSKQDDNTYAKYVKVDTKNGDPAKLHSEVSIESIDKNYAGKYEKDNYNYAFGNPTLKIKATDNVIKLYYNPILADVVVNHKVTTTTYKANGDVEEKIEAPITEKVSSLYKGDSYTAKLLGEGYTLIESDKYENVILKEGLNTINLNYTRKIDERAEASLKVNHNYTVKTWTLKDGKYVLIESVFPGTPDEINNLKATSKYTIAPKLGENYKVVSITPNVTANNEGKYEVVLSEGLNEYTINYEKILNTPKQADVTVVHHYRTIKIDETIETIETDDVLKANVGEDFTATTKPDGFNQVTPDSDLTQVVKETGNIINIYYEKDVRVPATIKVNHHYSITEYKLVTEIENGNEVVIPQWVTTGSGIVAVDVKGEFYIGSKYTPLQITNPDFDEYNYKHESGDITEQTLSSKTNVFDIYYNITLGDNLEDAQLTVKHIYETWRTCVGEDGKIIENEIIEDSWSADTISGKVGQTVKVDVKEKDAYKRYDTNGLSLKLGGDSEIVLRYKQIENTLGEKVSVEVQPYYVTYTKNTNENNETIITESTEIGTSKLYADSYAGQYFSAPLNEFYKKGFDFDEKLTTDEYNNVKLEKNNNVIKLYFSKEEDRRDKAELVVNHNYKFTTYKIVDGNRVADVKTGTIKEGIVDTLYVGDIYKAVVNENQFLPLEVKYIEVNPGLEIKLVKGTNTINFYYEGEKDLTKPATIIVNHHYKTTDLNGTVTEEKILGTAANSYVGVQFTATSDLKGTETLDAPFAVQNPQDLTLVLSEGENVINIFYERVIDTRKATTVRVVHKYYAYDTRIDPDKANKIAEGTFEEIFTTVEQGAWIGNQFTATLRTATGEGENTVYYALDPTDQLRSIVVGEVENEIILIYSRDYASPEPPVEPEPENPEPSVKPEPENPDPPVQPEPDDSEIIEDEDIPGGPVEVEDDKEEISSDDIILEDEEIPGGAAELPNTGGLPSDIFYGLGALAMMTGVLCRFKRKEDNDEE